MKPTQTKRALFVSLSIALLAMGLTACSGEEEAQASSRGNFQINAAALVETAPVETGPFSVRGSYAGEFSAGRTAEVAFEVSGRIIELDYEIGDRLQKGEVLARIDPTTYRQQVREAQAAVEMAQASVGEAEVNAANVEDDLKRKEPLLDRQLISEREIANLRAQSSQAKQQIAVAKATLEQNRARLQSARENLRHTEIRAPFDARIATKYVDLGTHVGPSQPVFRLVSERDIYLRANVPERDSASIQPGKQVALRIGALGGASVTGRVVRVAPAVDPQTRTVRVDVVIDPQQASDDAEQNGAEQTIAARVRPGMYAQVQIELGSRDNTVTMPRQALLEERGGAPFTWVVEDGKARKQTLLVGLQSRDRVEILDGLTGGEKIVLRGAEKLEPGAEVQSLADQKAKLNAGQAGATEGTQ